MTDWEAIIKRGVESDVLDYKAAQDWNELNRTGRAKFARHCMALANTKGGHVVVGVGEDASGKPALLTGLTEEQSLSFDPTTVGNFINRYADPQIEFTLERPVVDGKQFVVFDIKRFSQMPHVCTGGCDQELLQGVFYIRTADASSRPAYRASEVHALIQRAMRNQRTMLSRMIRSLLYEARENDPEKESTSLFAEELHHSRNFFKKLQHPSSRAMILELSLEPSAYDAERFSLSDLQECVSNAFAQCPQPSPFMDQEMTAQAYLTNSSLRYADRGRIWQLYRSGLFHYCAMELEQDQDQLLSYEKLCCFTAGCAAFCSHLCEHLGFSSEKLLLELTLDHVENRILAFPASSGERRNDLVCRIPGIVVKRTLTGEELIRRPEELAQSLICSVCERFQLPAKDHGDLPGLIREYFN